MPRAVRLIVLGRQGAGKGTQCLRLAARLGVRHVATGDLLRAEIMARTTLGLKIEAAVSKGHLVVDDLVLDVVIGRLSSYEARSSGYLLDGFPRTVAQAEALFDEVGPLAADLAVELHVPSEVALPRLAARRVCRGCGTTSTARASDPPVRTCENCGDRVARRADDTEEAIRRRLAIYDQESGPLLDWLAGKDLLLTVDGMGRADQVHGRLLDALSTRLPGAVPWSAPVRGRTALTVVEGMAG
jgi:adenylate kinase